MTPDASSEAATPAGVAVDDGTAGEVDPDSTGFEATEQLQREYPAEDFASPEDLAEVQRVTEGVTPEQTGLALEGVLQALRGDGVVDCEKLAADMMITPERAYEMVQTVVSANSRLITRNLFGGDEGLHSDFAKWAYRNHQEAYASASEACARTQSSRPMQKLVQARIAVLKSGKGTTKAKTEKQREEPEWSREGRRLRAEIDARSEQWRKNRASQRGWDDDE